MQIQKGMVAAYRTDLNQRIQNKENILVAAFKALRCFTSRYVVVIPTEGKPYVARQSELDALSASTSGTLVFERSTSSIEPTTQISKPDKPVPGFPKTADGVTERLFSMIDDYRAGEYAGYEDYFHAEAEEALERSGLGSEQMEQVLAALRKKVPKASQEVAGVGELAHHGFLLGRMQDRVDQFCLIALNESHGQIDLFLETLEHAAASTDALNQALGDGFKKSSLQRVAAEKIRQLITSGEAQGRFDEYFG